MHTVLPSPSAQSRVLYLRKSRSLWFRLPAPSAVSPPPTLPKPRGSLPLLSPNCVVLSWVWLPHLGLNPSASLPLQTHFWLLLQSITPSSIPVFFQLYWAATVSLGWCSPMAWSQSSPSSHAGAVIRGSCFPVTSWVKSLPSPWLKARPQLFNISIKPVKGYRYVKWPCQRLAASCCYAKQLWMALLRVSLPPAQACGGEDILYIFF